MQTFTFLLRIAELIFYASVIAYIIRRWKK